MHALIVYYQCLKSLNNFVFEFMLCKFSQTMEHVQQQRGHPGGSMCML